ncbi:MAG: hypothetical protein Q7S89_00920, partial [bacterium]|nr:hypothetical protein [bacterium]
RLEEGMPALITRGHLDIIERITVSFLLSIVMSSGVILALYKLSVADRFNAFNLTLSPRDFVSVMLVIESVSIVVALFFSVWRNRSNRHNRSRDDG